MSNKVFYVYLRKFTQLIIPIEKKITTGDHKRNFMISCILRFIFLLFLALQKSLNKKIEKGN